MHVIRFSLLCFPAIFNTLGQIGTSYAWCHTQAYQFPIFTVWSSLFLLVLMESFLFFDHFVNICFESFLTIVLTISTHYNIIVWNVKYIWNLTRQVTMRVKLEIRSACFDWSPGKNLSQEVRQNNLAQGAEYCGIDLAYLLVHIREF